MTVLKSIVPWSATVWAALLYSQSITHGVWPDLIVAGFGSTGSRLPSV